MREKTETTLPQDKNSEAIQAYRLPAIGSTINITTIAGVVDTVVSLGGMYRVTSTVAIQMALGTPATAADMDIAAGATPESFFIPANGTVSILAAAAGTVKLTRG